MSTHAAIIANVNGKIKKIYVHWDGYDDGVGATLRNHYTNKTKIEQLFAEGDVSALNDKIKNTIFYHRDRDEPIETTKAKEYASIAEAFHDSKELFIYVWHNEWFTNKIIGGNE